MDLSNPNSWLFVNYPKKVFIKLFIYSESIIIIYNTNHKIIILTPKKEEDRRNKMNPMPNKKICWFESYHHNENHFENKVPTNILLNATHPVQLTIYLPNFSNKFAQNISLVL